MNKSIKLGGFLLLVALALPSFLFAQNYQGKKILFIDSYHEGYGWSDGITIGVQTALQDSGAELKILRMDTKRNGSDDFKKAAALKAKAVIEEFKPDVVIAADDNASKYLIVPYYKDSDLPFVFCGVNWDASGYGFPAKNVTGMLEVTPIPQLIEQLQMFAQGNRLGFLAPELLTAHKELDNISKVFGLTPVAYFAKDFSDWQKGFKELQGKVDILILDSDGGLYSDKADEMLAFVEANTKIATGTTYDFMAPYTLIAFAKLAEEQGNWAATTALSILNGTKVASIPLVKNKEGKLIINTRIAGKLGIELPFEMIQAAGQVIE